ncbi:GNAT domain-containing protein [Chlamydoabsidia padenii]|nr:GNAT domain-containing protein [Chlamydoabsidia padenii]
MKQNEDLVLVGSKAVLVPYKPEHVKTYHDWMASPFLQEMTASEPLTLEEEYEMQTSWHEDDKKCTFIILASKTNSPLEKDMTMTDMKDKTVMIGDVNIFLNDCDGDLTFGEIEIMIAEEAYRRNGYGLEGLKMMMAYALKELGIKTFHAKISMKNKPSIHLFESKLAYYPVSSSEIFQETTLEWSIQQQQPRMTNNDDDDDYYGSKATATQKQACQALYDNLIDLWDNGINKLNWT